MRIASRIRTDNAIIWYGWAHREESPSAEDAYLIRYIQLRTPDGDYKLIESDYSDALQESDYLRDKYAIDVLPYKLYRILTRHQREAQLGGE